MKNVMMNCEETIRYISTNGFVFECGGIDTLQHTKPDAAVFYATNDTIVDRKTGQIIAQKK